jgi:hypothetical protein
LSSSIGEGTTTSSGLSLAGEEFSASRYGAFRDWSKNYFSPQPLPFDIPHYNQEIGIKMNSNKRKERPNDDDRGKGAKRNKVCNMVTFFVPIFSVATAMFELAGSKLFAGRFSFEHMTRARLNA